MRQDGGDELLAHAAASVGGEDEDVAEVGVGRVVRDHTGEAHLAVPVEGAEAQRMADRALHDLAWDSGRPVGAGEEAVDHVQVEPGRFRGDCESGLDRSRACGSPDDTLILPGGRAAGRRAQLNTTTPRATWPLRSAANPSLIWSSVYVRLISWSILSRPSR